MAKVLVVDDEFGIAEVLSAILEDEGHQVTIAINGRLALAEVARDRPDLIISDFMMPVMDGPALLHAVRDELGSEQLPVVLMSSMPEAHVATRAAGYAAFMRKPFRVDDVIKLVERLLPAT